MPGLNTSLFIADQALQANRGALDVTSNNIANANTPGYSREQVELTEAIPVEQGDISYGSGVDLEQVQSVRDQVLELRIAEETQQQASSQTQYTALQQVQGLFSNSTQGIGADLTAFFNSLNQLSTDPTSIPQRQAVLTAAQNLAGDFQQTEQNLDSIQSGMNQSVTATVSQINSLTQQIAQLNGQVGQLQKLGQDPGVLLDQETQAIDQLSQLTDVNVIQTEAGETITTGSGTALVVGNQSFALQVSPGTAGTNQIYAQGQNITSTIQSGQLGGTLQIRDQVIPEILSQLDNLAGQFTTSINNAQASGYDLNGNKGQPLFSDPPGPGAAANIQVAITDPNLIAASSDKTPGSNGNIANLLAVQNQALPSGADPLDTYSDMVSLTGNLTAQAEAEVNASQTSLTQLQDQRGSLSGVDIDEETTNLVNYQNAYEAAARVVTTIDQLTQYTLEMGASAQAVP